MVEEPISKGKGIGVVGYVPAMQSIVTIKPTSTIISVEKPTENVDKNFTNTDDVAYWGETNIFPNDWEKEIEQNDTLRDAIEKEVDRIYAGGIEVGYSDKNGNWIEYETPEIEEFMCHPRTLHAFEQTITDYVKHRIPFPEILISKDRSRAYIAGLSACHCRFSKQDDSGYIPAVYYNRNWVLGRYANSDDTKKIFIFDPLIDEIDLIRAESLNRYFYKVPIVTHRTFYPVAPAYAVKSSGWLNNSNKVALFYSYLLDNQMSPKFHIEVDEAYLATKYAERWEEAGPEEINNIFMEELKHFNDMMHGVKNTGNNLMTLKRLDKILSKEVSAWSLHELKGSLFEQGYLALDDKATLHIQRAVGIDPTLQGGDSPGMGAGSGSNKREAFNIRMSTATRHVTAILSPFYFIFKYNGWTGPNGERLELKIITPFLQTLNQVTSSQRSNSLPDAANN